ncbi:MAG: serine/threonine-protein kinase [Myxococcota bacterium]
MKSSDGRDFRLQRKLGAGSYGEVMLATIHSSGNLTRRVAVKLLHRELSADASPVRRLRDEAQMLASLDHPVILSAHELIRLDGRMAMVCEYVDGVDLETLIQGKDVLPRGPVLDMVEQIADALHVAWMEHQIVHRDVKPSNIRIGQHGNVKLLDFGLARSDLRPRSAHTTEGTLLGTRPYIAPECYDLDDAPPRPSSDIFALGCVLYEAWTRTRFFENLDGTDLLAVTDTPATYQPWLDRRLSIPTLDPIADLLAQMLAFDPRHRPAALLVAQRCEQIAADLPVRQTLRRWARERRDESRPTERVSRVDAQRLTAMADLDEPSTAVTVQEVVAVGLSAPLPGELGIATAPAVQAVASTPPRPRSAPAPLEAAAAKPGQATTRWIAPVIQRGSSDDPTPSGSWGLVLGSTLLLALSGALLAAAYLTGALDVLLR